MITDKIFWTSKVVAEYLFFWGTFKHEGIDGSVEHLIMVGMISLKIFYPFLQLHNAELFMIIAYFLDPLDHHITLELRVV